MMSDHPLRARFLALRADLDRYEAGRFPTESELVQAPCAHGWRPGSYPKSGEPNLRAMAITGHPRLGTQKHYCSSPLYFVDPDLRWVRTQGHLLRLGRPHPDAREHKSRPRAVTYPMVDRYADSCGYVMPPEDVVPAGRIGEDPAWEQLFDWFEAHTWDAVDAVKVYVARRYDRDIRQVAVDLDGWIKDRLEDGDRRDAALRGAPWDYPTYGGRN